MSVSARGDPFLSGSGVANHVEVELRPTDIESQDDSFGFRRQHSPSNRQEDRDRPRIRKTSFSENLITLTKVTGSIASEDDILPASPTSPASRKYTDTSFSPAVVEELEQTDPGVLEWLRSTPGVVFQGILVTTFIIFETGGGLLTSAVMKPDPPLKYKPLPSSVVVVEDVCSMVLGFVITVVIFIVSGPPESSIKQRVARSMRAVFDRKQILNFAAPSAVFAVASVLSMLAYSKLDAGLKKILDQFRLILMASMSSMVLGKRYSIHQWFALFILFLAVCNFYVASVKHDEITELHQKCKYPQHCFDEPGYAICGFDVDGSFKTGVVANKTGTSRRDQFDVTTFPVGDSADKTDLEGLLYSLLGTCFNALGGLLQEKAMKRDLGTNFATQKTQICFVSLPVSMLLSVLVPMVQGGKEVWWAENEAEGSGAGFFQGFRENSLTLVAIGVGLMTGWMSGLICKQLSAVIRTICKSIILLNTVFCAGTLLKVCHADPLQPTMYMLAFIVVISVALFASMPKS